STFAGRAFAPAGSDEEPDAPDTHKYRVKRRRRPVVATERVVARARGRARPSGQGSTRTRVTTTGLNRRRAKTPPPTSRRAKTRGIPRQNRLSARDAPGRRVDSAPLPPLPCNFRVSAPLRAAARVPGPVGSRCLTLWNAQKQAAGGPVDHRGRLSI